MVPGTFDVQKNRSRFSEHPQGLSESQVVTIIHTCAEQWLLTFLPFTSSGASHYQNCSRSLGSTNPCPKTVHIEPFSASVLNDRNWIFATSTKICTTYSCTKCDNFSLQTECMPSYMLESLRSIKKINIGYSLQRHPFSGLVHSAGELLHIP